MHDDRTILRPDDLRIDTYRSGFLQPVHVRVTHLPTGCSAHADDMSQIRARETALIELREAVAHRRRALRRPQYGCADPTEEPSVIDLKRVQARVPTDIGPADVDVTFDETRHDGSATGQARVDIDGQVIEGVPVELVWSEGAGLHSAIRRALVASPDVPLDVTTVR